MAKTLDDLNSILFEQLEKLRDEDSKSETVKVEIEKAKAMTGVAEVITRTAELSFKVMAHMNEYRTDGHLAPVPKLLTPGKDNGV